MKRLLSLTALVLLCSSAVGCGCCGIGNMGLMRFGHRTDCYSCNPCNSCGRCNSCNSCESYSPVIAPSGCGCGCGAGGPIGDGMILRAPTISPAAEAYSVTPQ
jgi:hypothetical protein